MVDAPVGDVNLQQGILRTVYMGFDAQRESNATANPINWHDVFTYQYQKGFSLNLTKSISVTVSAQLGVNFFGAQAKFGLDVTASATKQLGTHEQEALEWTSDFNGTLKPGDAITVVAVYYQDLLVGTLQAGEVKTEYNEKFAIKQDTFFFDGLLNQAEVEQRVRQLLMTATTLRLPAQLPKSNANITLAEKNIAKVSATTVKTALSSLPQHVILKTQAAKLKGCHLLDRPMRRKVA